MKVLLAAACACMLSGCGIQFANQNPAAEIAARPTLALETEVQRQLRALPRPPKRIDVSVYSFDDQTGQQQPGELPQYSRAVTQGGLAFLKQALLDAGDHGWFRVLERGGLNHLLKEREIIRSTRAAYAGPEGTALPAIDPLLYSGLLLEGGIIAYESNITTGGAGARYLGIGGSTEYRRDIVTVALRAVSVRSGEVLAAVTTAKTIFSIKLQAGAFKYVTFDELLEAEAGFTVNEPPQLAVRQAIEMAVYALVMEGYARDLWKFADAAAGASLFDDYRSKQQLAIEQSRSEVPKPEMVQQSAVRAKPKTVLPLPKDAPFTVASGYYYQLAALPVWASEAEKFVRTLAQTGLPLSLQRAEVDGVLYCRVLVGPFSHAAAAEKYSAEVNAASQRYAPDGSGTPFLKKL